MLNGAQVFPPSVLLNRPPPAVPTYITEGLKGSSATVSIVPPSGEGKIGVTAAEDTPHTIRGSRKPTSAFIRVFISFPLHESENHPVAEGDNRLNPVFWAKSHRIAIKPQIERGGDVLMAERSGAMALTRRRVFPMVATQRMSVLPENKR